MSTQKNRLNEMETFFEHPKDTIKLMGKTTFTILRSNFFLTKPVTTTVTLLCLLKYQFRGFQ